MITGAHFIIYSTNPEKDRTFLRDVLKFPNIDAGEGWLIFGLPPAEMAIHPSEEKNKCVTPTPPQSTPCKERRTGRHERQ